MSISAPHPHPYAQKLSGLKQPHLNTPEIPGTPNAVSQIQDADLMRELSPFEFSAFEQPHAKSFNQELDSEKSSIKSGHKRYGGKSGFDSVGSDISFDNRVKQVSIGKSTTSLSSGSSTSRANNRRVRSVDLSHLYLLGGDKDTQFTSTNESIADISHRRISQYLGNDSTASLVPRFKTIEMYRENVKKSKDPDVLFEYAQYMLQTALSMDVSRKGAKKGDGDDDEDDDDEDDSNYGTGLSSDAELRTQFLKEALHYLKKLSVKGYKEAQYLLADSYSSGAFGKINGKEAFTLFQSSAKHGHVEAAYRTAICFEEGLGTTRDSRKCIEFLKFAASRNHPAAMFKLGLYAFYGRMGLPSDLNTKKNGIKWLSRAVAKANPLICAAPYELAKIYEKGFLDIVIADMKYAMELYVQAASLGHVPSATLLGKIYEVGNEIVPQDVPLSVNYYTVAAEGGDPEAMLGLCAWYLVGAEPAFGPDEKEAFEWALKAAKYGFPKAQFTVGYFLEKGKGCKAHLDSAHRWYQLAAENKDSRAINKLKSQGHSRSKSKNMSVFSFGFLNDNVEKSKKATPPPSSSVKLDERTDSSNDSQIKPEFPTNNDRSTNSGERNLREQQTPLLNSSDEKPVNSLFSPASKYHEPSPITPQVNSNFYSTDIMTPKMTAGEFESSIQLSPKTPNLRPPSEALKTHSDADTSKNHSSKSKSKKKKKSKDCIIM